MRANFQIIFFPISVGQEPSVKERDPERNGNPYSSVVITESWLLFSRTVYPFAIQSNTRHLLPEYKSYFWCFATAEKA